MIDNIEDFKKLLELNPNYKSYNSTLLSNKLNISIETIKEWRNKIKTNNKNITINIPREENININFELKDIPFEHELEKNDYRVDPRIPEMIPGFAISSFQHNKVWYKKEEGVAVNEDSTKLIIETIQKLQNNAKPYIPFNPNKRDYSEGICLIMSLTDFHINKQYLNDGATIEQRCEDYFNAVVNTYNRARKLYPIVNVKFVTGSDFFHTDGFTSTTTKGTVQHMNTMPHTAFEKGLEVLVKSLDFLIEHVPTIDIISLPGNHARASEYFLGKTLQAYYRNYKQITFDVDLTFRKVVTFGNYSAMLHHGDNKPEYIVQEFANFYPREFVNKYVEVISADKHHNLVKDIGRVTFRQLPAGCGKDSWTTQMGYYSRAIVLTQMISKEEGRLGEIEYKL